VCYTAEIGGEPPNGMGFTRAVTAGKNLHYKTNCKARMAAADQPRKRRRVKALVGRQPPVVTARLLAQPV